MIQGSATVGKMSNMWGGSTIIRIKTERNGYDEAADNEPCRVPDNSVLQNISAEDMKRPVLMLEELPAEFAAVLRRYDLNRNGTLDREETIHCAADLARMRHQVEQGTVHINAFPDFAQPLLEEHDLDGDGTLEVHEMICAFQALERERQKARLWFRVTLAALAFILILLLSISGLLYYILDVMRDSDVKEGGMMVVKDTNLPVQTASFELMVKEGRLVERNSERKCGGDQECPLQVAEAAERRAVSSALSDPVLDELKQLKIMDGAAWVQLRVFAVQRLPDAASEHGSVVVVYSHLGEVELDGAKIKLTARLSAVLARSGIAVPAGQGYLESGEGQPVQLVGTFNSLGGK